MFKYKNLNSKIQKGQLLWLIRRSSGGTNYRGNMGWSFPKGGIDEGETVEQAALREVAEEGGIGASIIKKLETLKVFFSDQNGERVMKFITYFLMKYESDTPEGHDWETAETRWVEVEEGKKMLAFRNEKQLLQKAYEEQGN